MTQSSLWHQQQKSSDYAELCNALFEREIIRLSAEPVKSVELFQRRLKSLPYYVQRTAYNMLAVDSPLELDIQNATWSTKQSKSMPTTTQNVDDVQQWYMKWQPAVGLVVPLNVDGNFLLDSVDRIDRDKQRFRTNQHGWFALDNLSQQPTQLLKPSKKVMMAACAGHCWRNSAPVTPKIPSMRELLLSCSINWRNFKRPLQINDS